MKIIILLGIFAFSIAAQTQTTGRIAGTVTDQHGAFITGAQVTLKNRATGKEQIATADGGGNYAFAFLVGGVYQLHMEAEGFAPFNSELVTVRITETTTADVILTLPGITPDPITVEITSPLIKTDSPTRGQILDAGLIDALPLGTRNFTQLLGLAAGTSVYLTDSTVVGRNTQNISVNGLRVAQNNIQINGIDAIAASAYVFPLSLANPAAESIAELKVQTSLYDATYGRAGGGSVQLVTKSGSNNFRGGVYEHFRDTSLTANNPFLKALAIKRPVLERNVFGFLLGGPIKRDRAFFFISYQTTNERNGASRLNSLSVNVLVDSRLTDDRSDTALDSIFPGIAPVARKLLKAPLPNGQFVIPTPQAGGRYFGSAISSFREEQFNANLDYRISQRNWFTAKFFFAQAPSTVARAGAINVPGFAVDQEQEHHLLSLQDVYDVGSQITNEARIGYSFAGGDNFPEQPVNDSSVGITRPTAAFAPGMPSIIIGLPGVGVQFGTGPLQASLATSKTTSLIDTVSIIEGKHSIRLGGEVRSYVSNLMGNLTTRGIINFMSFSTFLTDTTQTAQLGNGIQDRSFRSTDYNFFVQDDWKFSSKLTVNLGVRYELDLPPYESQGRFATFDPERYSPRLTFVGITPLGPPLPVSFVQAGNARGRYDLADVPNVSKRILKSIDPDNFAPRIGFAYSLFKPNTTVVRGGYGIFYSRASFQNAGGASFTPPFYFRGITTGMNASDPFPDPGPEDEYPKFVPDPLLAGNSIDRNNRTPYVQQYNLGVQFEISKDNLLEIAYVGSRGRKLFRGIGINQARLVASMNDRIVNAVTDEVITTNTPGNAQRRAPYQGVGLGSIFVQDQTSGRSSYNSLQVTATRRLRHGLQFLTSYTFAKSIDDGSGFGGGSGTTGVLNVGLFNDTNGIVGNQLERGANRGVSDFDRGHRFVGSFVWNLPDASFVDLPIMRTLLTGWQLAGIVTAMSGLPIDVVDSGSGTFYLGTNAGGGRPSFVSGISPIGNEEAGYYFNPYAFFRPVVQTNQPIPSSGGRAVAGAPGTDFGNVGRNALRGPSQFNIDLSISKHFRINESMNLEFRADAFNLLNNVNFANPVSNLNVANQAINQMTGRINPRGAGEFGRIISTSNNPRIIELGARFNF